MIHKFIYTYKIKKRIKIYARIKYMINSKDIITKLENHLQKCIDIFQKYLSTLAPSNAHPDLLNNILVDGKPLKSIAMVNVAGTRALTIKPFDMSSKTLIFNAVNKSGLGTLREEKDSILLNLSPLTSEYLNNLLKKLKEEGEKTRVSMRLHRQNIRKEIDAFKKTHENEYKKTDKLIQESLDKFIKMVDLGITTFEKKINS
jgi:ribosome recycling factor